MWQLSIHDPQAEVGGVFTEIEMGELYFCLEQRLVRVRGQVIELNSKRIWYSCAIAHTSQKGIYLWIDHGVGLERGLYFFIPKKAVSNHMSNLRKKLKVTPDALDYIKNIVGVGYKFEAP